MARTAEDIEAQIEALRISLSSAPEQEIDGAIKIKFSVKDKLNAINALEQELTDLTGDDSPTVQSKRYNYDY